MNIIKVYIDYGFDDGETVLGYFTSYSKAEALALVHKNISINRDPLVVDEIEFGESGKVVERLTVYCTNGYKPKHFIVRGDWSNDIITPDCLKHLPRLSE